MSAIRTDRPWHRRRRRTLRHIHARELREFPHTLRIPASSGETPMWPPNDRRRLSAGDNLRHLSAGPSLRALATASTKYLKYSQLRSHFQMARHLLYLNAGDVRR